MPKAPTKRPSARRNRRKNPSGEQEAAKLSEAFHGRPAREYVDIEGSRLDRVVLAQLGRLIELQVRADDGEKYKLRPTGVRLASSPDGRSLYFEGGDQECDLSSLGIEGDQVKDHVDLGTVFLIRYHTRKGFHSFEPIDYWHKFGEESGIRPTLHYDSLNRLLYVTGGNYRIRPEGIVD